MKSIEKFLLLVQDYDSALELFQNIIDDHKEAEIPVLVWKKVVCMAYEIDAQTGDHLLA